ncbi:MAG: hypothetical protein AUK47_25200 [Deltaproteobacteria bacterium CG2_30_63_29]|nr:MAG: hypothetical protein AUK47_25200 [Deltaproteobacteria bacterium CG2_30_63_29]
MSDVIEVTNPASGEVITEVRSYRIEEARQALERARRAQLAWRETPIAERASVIRRFRDLLLDHAEEMCRLISQENGKVLQESLQMEVFPIVDLASYFASRAEHILAPTKIPLHLLKHRRSYLHYKPRGVVLIISPWNFPFSIPYGEVIMALLAGNAVVLKPASLTPLACLEGRKLFDQAGLPPDLFQVLPCPGKVASEMIERGVDYVNFTGSTNVGVHVSEVCGRKLIPCSMELGGKDPAIVLPDADLDIVEGSLVWGAFANAGQVCASIERAYVHESIYDEVVERVVERVRGLKVGDPLVDGTDMGPMTDRAQRAIVEAQVRMAIEQGATALTGGELLDRPGQFYPPTVLINVTPDMECHREETFGPTLPILKVKSVEQAIALANDSPYGLDAYVYSSDKARARQVAERLEVGTVMINETLITHAMPETPWGGVKQSGVGRVHSDQGLRDLCVSYHVNEEVLPTMKWSPFWQPYSHAMFDAVLGAARTINHSEWGRKAGGAKAAFANIMDLVRKR